MKEIGDLLQFHFGTLSQKTGLNYWNSVFLVTLLQVQLTNHLPFPL